MAVIFCADIYCDECGDDIKKRIATELWEDCETAEVPSGDCTRFDFLSRDDLDAHLRDMDERAYDSGDYPKYCSDDEESDVPQHCGSHDDCLAAEVLDDGSKVGYFFGNSLTSYGVDYVKEAVAEGGLVAALWKASYDWLDYPGECDECGAITDSESDCLCESCEESQCVNCQEITELDDDGYCSGCAEPDDDPDFEDEPCEGDYTITPCGSLGGKSGLGRVEGKFIGEFDSDDKAIAEAKRLMTVEQFWPNIWLVSDHGNWTLYKENSDEA